VNQIAMRVTYLIDQEPALAYGPGIKKRLASRLKQGGDGPPQPSAGKQASQMEMLTPNS
jgi:hypothetical protein